MADMSKAGNKTQEMVSIIIPAYQSEAFIENSVRSALKQTWQNVEVIVVENGSTDRTTEVVQNIDDQRLSLFHSDKGVCRARNTGMDAAHGEFLMFLDADDRLAEDAVERLMGVMEADVDIISARYYGDRPFEQYKYMKYEAGSQEYLLKCLYTPTKRGNATGNLYRTSFIKENSIQFDPELAHAEDSVFFISLLLKRPVVADYEEPVYHVYSNPESATRKQGDAFVGDFCRSISRVYGLLQNETKEVINGGYIFALNQVLVMLVHANVKKTVREKIQWMKKLFEKEEIRTAIKNADISQTDTAKRAVFLCMKKRQYLAISVLTGARAKANDLRARRESVNTGKVEWAGRDSKIPVQEAHKVRELQLHEIKEIEKELLIQFDKLCKVNHLYYTLCGGTLLGAVRHHGFIPWDDDIDVLMPRPDYDRLLNNLDIDFSTLPGYCAVANWKEGTHDYPFLKLVDTRTKIEIPYLSESFKGNHIWIDIFPIDGNPDDDEKLKKLYKDAIFTRQLIRLKTANPAAGKSRMKKLLKPFLVAGVKHMNNRALCEKLDQIARTYSFEEHEKIGGVLWGYGPQERIDKKAYMTPVKVQFEGEVFNAPSNYDEYLTGLYGDYMKLPPKEQQITHELHAYIEE